MIAMNGVFFLVIFSNGAVEMWSHFATDINQPVITVNCFHLNNNWLIIFIHVLFGSNGYG